MNKFFTIIALGISTQAMWAQGTFKPTVLGTKSNQKVVTKSITVPEAQLQVTRAENDLPIFIKGKIKQVPGTKYARASIEGQVFGYLEAFKATLKINKPQEEFQIQSNETEPNGHRHVHLQQTYKGLPVYGAELIAHTNGHETEMLNGRYYPTPGLSSISPKLSEAAAINLAEKNVEKLSHKTLLTAAQKQILRYEKPKVSLIIYHENEDEAKERLCYQIELRPNFVERWQYFVDAHTGEILNKFNHTCALDGPASATARDLNNINRTIKTYQKGTQYIMVDAERPMFPGGAINTNDPQGVIWTINGNNTTPEQLDWSQVTSTNNTWANPTAVSAHYNAGVAYDYYLKTHGRNSLNGKGGSIISIINITEADPNTGKISQMDNAFWNGEFMGYGNGKDFFRPLAGGLDVAGHEMTHGVIENTANLNYQGQSGAINESMADCFGVLIDRQDGDFVVGEDVMKNGRPFLRSLADPNKGDQPAHMSERYTGQEDNGGVHINSGIPNRAFYLFVTALSGNEELKKQKAEKVYYRALTKYLTRSSKFVDLRAAVVQSCKDLAADIGAEAELAANNAFDAVGIGGGTSTTPTTKPVEDLPANTGTENILSYDACAQIIYLSSDVNQPESSARELVKNVIIDHKPSVTDDGSYAYYVAKIKNSAGQIIDGGTINRVNLIGTPKVEILSQDKVWRNVAISKDGKRLVANTIITNEGNEQYIYIFDLISGKSEYRKLYNPTYSQNVKSAGTPLFSDALEWEYNGENIIYDAFNQINSQGFTNSESTSSIEYWDVGLMKVWDIASNGFGDGSIVKIFSNLARGESIGNPSFAKKSTSVVAFDRLFDNQFYILTVDFESKGTDGSYKKAEFKNNTIGFPEFSSKDNKIVFNREVSTSRKCNADSTNTSILGILADKVNNDQLENTRFISSSSLAVWYTIGKRDLPTKATQIINMPVVSDRVEGTAASIDLNAKTDKGIDVLYQIKTQPAGIAKIENGKIVLTGKPGKVTVTGSADGNTTINAATATSSFCVSPVKPVISVTELANAILLQSNADSTNIWFRDGKEIKRNVKGIEIQDAASYTLKVSVGGCESVFSEAFKASAAAAQNIQTITVTDKLQGNTTTIELPAKTDQGNNVTYTVVSGPAVVVGNKLSPTGQPGRVKVKGFAPAGLKFAAAETSFEFCVNPAKPNITITQTPANYVFTSSSATGNSWFRNGTALNEFGTSINVVSTNSFTVQVTIEGCKSEMSDAKAASKEIVLAEEAWIREGLAANPSPIDEQLVVSWGVAQVKSIQLYNMQGKLFIAENNPKGKEKSYNTKQLSKGMYFLQIETSNGMFSKKLMKQ